jgi:hypothetical protein
MQLADGDPAAAWDTWLRVITDERYFKGDGTLSNNAFSGRRVISPPDPPRPWSLELSGALLSMIPDLRHYAIAFCGDKFAGYMFQKVENLRNEDTATDVLYTPRAGQEAHADLVAYRLDVERKYVLRDWLQDSIQCVRRGKIAAIEALRRAGS